MGWIKYYRKEIKKMIKEITDIKDLQLVYGMALSAYKDVKKDSAK